MSVFQTGGSIGGSGDVFKSACKVVQIRASFGDTGASKPAKCAVAAQSERVSQGLFYCEILAEVVRRITGAVMIFRRPDDC